MKPVNHRLAQFGQALLPAFFVLLVGLCLAQTAAAQSYEGDPPGRVARLSDLSGQVWLYSPDAGEWVSAVRNRPLTTGDRLATDAGARAELQVGSSTLRVDAGSELEILRLDDDTLAVQLHSGSAAARLRSAEAAREFSLTTDEGRFRAEVAGRYRFDRIDRASHLTVERGQAVYEGSRSALTVNSGQHAEFWIDSAGVAQYSLLEPVRDRFAAWTNERDGYDDRGAVASRYVSPEMTGAEDLDRYGVWQQSADYGALWIPRGVSSGWAPYSSGHWAYVRPWGWTWVDDAPWGFAPFHYGRWVYVRNTWCWAPGSRVARPIYAPALVGWVGGSVGGVSVAVGSAPAVGWFPLGPREVYVPSYRYSPRYVRDINITHVTNVTQINNVVNLPPERRDFANRKFPHALTVVPANVVVNRQPVAPAAAAFRGRGLDRDLTNQPARITALTAPPVGAPVAAARLADPRSVRPPVGVGIGGRIDNNNNAGLPRPAVRDMQQPGGVGVRPVDIGRAARPDDRRVATPPSSSGDMPDNNGAADGDSPSMGRPPVAATPVVPAGPNPSRAIPPSVRPNVALPAPPGERRSNPAFDGGDRRFPSERSEPRAPLPGVAVERRAMPGAGRGVDEPQRMPLPTPGSQRQAAPLPPVGVGTPQPQVLPGPQSQPRPIGVAPVAPPRVVEAARPVAAPVIRPQVPEQQQRTDRQLGRPQQER